MVEISQEDFEMLQEAKANQEAEAAKKEQRKQRGKIYRARRNHADQTVRENHSEEWKAAFDSFKPEG